MRKTEVKQKIVDAAWQLFYEKGYDATTVDEIISLSGTSKGSFYYYFESKDTLLSTLAEVLDAEYSRLEKVMDPKMHALDKLYFLNRQVHQFIEHKVNMDLLASMYSTQLISKGDRSLMDQNRVYYRLITDIVEEGQKKGEIKSEKSVRAIVKYYSMCERALISDWCLSRGEYSLEEYSDEYMPIMMESFRA